MKAYEHLDRLLSAQTNEQIIKAVAAAWDEKSDDFFLGLNWMLSDNTVGVDSIPYIEDTDETFKTLFSVENFYHSLKLMSSISDKDKKIATIRGFAEKSNVLEWNRWYRRLLLKDFKAQLPAKLIVKTLEILVENP